MDSTIQIGKMKLKVRVLKLFDKFQLPQHLDLVSLALAVIAFVLHVVGTSVPVWWIVHEEDVQHEDWTFFYGIWVIVDCKSGNCITITSVMHGTRAWLIGPAVLLVMSAALLLLAILAICSHFRFSQQATFVRKLCVVLSSGAGIIIILAVLIFVKKKAGLRPSIAPETSDGNPGWALFLSASGAVVAIGNAVLVGMCVTRYSHKNIEKRKLVFGIHAQELEIDVNALRRGDLRQGKKVNMTSIVHDVIPVNTLQKTPRVSTLPNPGGVSSNHSNGVVNTNTIADVHAFDAL